MLKLKVDDGVLKREVVSRRNGQTYTFFEQTGVLYLGTEVRTIRLSHSKEDHVVKPGLYGFDAEKSLRVDNYGSIALSNRLALTPVVAGKGI